MRRFLAFAVVPLLAVFAVAQQPTTALSSTDSTHAVQWTPPAASLEAVKNSPYQLKFNVAPSDPMQNTCWFIRSYIFKRADGAAPVMTGETTCTPSTANTLRRAKKTGAKFVPLSW